MAAQLTDDEWNLLETYCYLTILNQILFVIEAEQCAKPVRNMINELLLPIEHIAKEKEMFLEMIRQIKWVIFNLYVGMLLCEIKRQKLIH